MLAIELHNRQQAWAAIKAQVFPFLAASLQAGATWVLTIDKKKRSSKQNRRYWGKGVLAQIAVQAKGGRFGAETWHEMFKRSYIGVIELPNGEVIGESSASLTTKEFCDFCDEVEAYAVTELKVIFQDLEPKC